MRFVGIALVAAALAFSAGGVSLRRAVAEQPDASAGKPAIEVIEYPPKVTPGVHNSCPVVQDTPVVVRIPRASLDFEGFTSLNTLGYNYRRPDDPPDRHIPSAAAPQPQP
jgi:hypothetical protein